MNTIRMVAIPIFISSTDNTTGPRLTEGGGSPLVSENKENMIRLTPKILSKRMQDRKDILPLTPNSTKYSIRRDRVKHLGLIQASKFDIDLGLIGF